MSRLISLGLVMDCSMNWMRNVLIASAGERGKSFNISISYIKYIQNVRSMTIQMYIAEIKNFIVCAHGLCCNYLSALSSFPFSLMMFDMIVQIK